jgi:hypothetical protein
MGSGQIAPGLQGAKNKMKMAFESFKKKSKNILDIDNYEIY